LFEVSVNQAAGIIFCGFYSFFTTAAQERLVPTTEATEATDATEATEATEATDATEATEATDEEAVKRRRRSIIAALS
jgi:hypothetical protein